jgi:hypothetical protein
VVHVIVVAAQFLIYRPSADRRLRNNILRTKHDEQVPKRRSVFGTVVPLLPSACATREVVVKEYCNRDFVDPGQ